MAQKENVSGSARKGSQAVGKGKLENGTAQEEREAERERERRQRQRERDRQQADGQARKTTTKLATI